ncbi:cell division protein FtsQ/DivIB [Lachnospiraceae bacterium OttesenSCG-928-E19]|nr:cell division protein FtsQ/DivIB [Lachnospiraceae bacterium OttesenSCG-928-E19]
MRKSIWFWLSFVVAILLAVYFATRIIMVTMGNGAASRVKSISISADSSTKNLSNLGAVVAIAPGANTFKVDLDNINARLGTVPDIKESAIRRMPNGNLSIKVKLHRAIALWTDGQNLFPLSADGTIIKRVVPEKPDGTIVFRGSLPSDISEISKVAHNMASDINYIEWIEDRRWNLYTTGNITVLLPEIDPYSAVTQLMMLHQNHNILAKKITVLDMRDPARILVK